MLEKCLLNVLELIWNQRLGHKKTKLNICHRMLTSSTQLQNSSFHVVERTRTFTKCQKMKNARAKRAKILFFNVKYANLRGFLLWSWLLKLPNAAAKTTVKIIFPKVTDVHCFTHSLKGFDTTWQFSQLEDSFSFRTACYAWTCCPFGFKETDWHTHGKLLAN